MKNASKAALAVIGISLLCSRPGLGQDVAAAKRESVGMSSASLDNLTRALQAEVDNGHIHGAVVMINCRGKQSIRSGWLPGQTCRSADENGCSFSHLFDD